MDLTIDDAAEQVEHGLQAQGYQVRRCLSDADCLAWVRAGGSDAILVAVDENSDARAIVRQVSGLTPKPILVLRAPGNKAEALELMELGAHDFVCGTLQEEPEEALRELSIRLASALRLAHAHRVGEGQIVLDNITIDPSSHTVWKGDKAVDLTRTEYQLLVALAAEPGQLVSYRALLQSVWSDQQRDQLHYLRTYMHRLRVKLGWTRAADHGPQIVAVRGEGYRILLPSA
jgi:two-component system KDP operon response regulator KdpE